MIFVLKSSDILNKNNLGVKKYKANQKQHCKQADLLYVMIHQGVFHKVANFLASADIRVFDHTCLLAMCMLLLIGLILFIPKVFLSSIIRNS